MKMHLLSLPGLMKDLSMDQGSLVLAITVIRESERRKGKGNKGSVKVSKIRVGWGSDI